MAKLTYTATVDLDEDQILDILAMALEVDRKDLTLSKVIGEKNGRSTVDIHLSMKKDIIVSPKPPEKEYIPIVQDRPWWWDPCKPTITWTTTTSTAANTLSDPSFTVGDTAATVNTSDV